jgi:hypothetical protein
VTKRIELSGQTFGRLLVLPKTETRGDRLYWFCRCKCGAEKFIKAADLKRGTIVSCGCRMRETIAERIRLNTTHGQAANGGTSTFHSWNHMKARCTNPNNPAYKDYGGRGITVCHRWLASFENFYADMGDCPPGKSIERIDNSKGYWPGNCKWGTKKEQSLNRRPKSKVFYKYKLKLNGQSKTIREWSAITGIKYGTIWMRLQYGWSVKLALTP